MRAKNGFSIIEALVAVGILSVFVLVGSQVVVHISQYLFGLEQRSEVNSFVAKLGNQVHNTSAVELFRACRDEITGTASQCIDLASGAALAGRQTPSLYPVARLWKIPLGWKGETVPATSAKMCAELVECKEILKNQLLDVRINVWWINDGKYKSRIFGFRRAML